MSLYAQSINLKYIIFTAKHNKINLNNIHQFKINPRIFTRTKARKDRQTSINGFYLKNIYDFNWYVLIGKCKKRKDSYISEAIPNRLKED